MASKKRSNRPKKSAPEKKQSKKELEGPAVHFVIKNTKRPEELTAEDIPPGLTPKDIIDM